MADARSGPDVAQLVAEHHQAVYRYAYRLTGSVQDAEDLTQQVFLIAQRKIGQLRNMDAAGSWLFAILRNCFLKDKQRRRPALAGDLALNVDLIAEERPPEGVDGDRLQEALEPPARRLPAGGGDVLLRGVFVSGDRRPVGDADRHGDEPAGQGEGPVAVDHVRGGAGSAKAAARCGGRTRKV